MWIQRILFRTYSIERGYSAHNVDAVFAHLSFYLLIVNYLYSKWFLVISNRVESTEDGISKYVHVNTYQWIIISLL